MPNTKSRSSLRVPKMRLHKASGQATQAALGHASIVSTCIHAKVDKARLREAVGA